MIKIVAKQYIKKETASEFIELATELIAMTRAYDVGCMEYSLYRDMQHPEIMTIIEEWETPEALNLHMESRHFKDIFPKLEAFYEKPIEVNMYTPVEA